MKHRLKHGLALVLSVAVTGLLGCSSTVDEVTNSIDCKTVCERYRDCFDPDYDVDGCSDKCESRAGSDEDRQRQLRMCDACIDDRSCLESFACGDDCLGIVP